MTSNKTFVNIVDGFDVWHVYRELTEYILQGNLNVRIHRDINGEMWNGT